MKRNLLCCTALIVALCGPLAMRPAHADAPPFALVKDINTASQPTDGITEGTLFATVNNTILFSGTTLQTGAELWRTDGTDAGTHLVKDIQIGAGSSLGYFGVTSLVLSTTLLLNADDGAHGRELWVSDGTAAGTLMLKDLWPGADSGFPQNFVASGDRAFFTAQIEESQFGLWITDGTPTGTTLLHSFSAFLPSFAMMGSMLMFGAADSGSDTELWRSDGTAAGTVLVKDINPGSAASGPLVLVARSTGQLLFNADDGTHGRELWRSDGTTAGTVLVTDMRPGPFGSNPSSITRLLGGNSILDPERIVFSADDGTHGNELWTTDGTDAGTQLIKDINPSMFGSGPSLLGIAPRLGKGRSRTFFFMDDGSHGGELWITDGTLTNTLMLADINTGTRSSTPSSVISTGNISFFAATSDTAGRELWKTDGTPAGTAQVADIAPGSKSSDLQDLTTFDGRLYFTSDDGVHGRELWRSDGSTTTLLKDIGPNNDTGVARVLGVALGALYFTADDGTTGMELWKTDGTSQGTVQVKNIAPDVGSIDLNNLYGGDGYNAAALGDRLAFGFGPESRSTTTGALWMSDGSAADTTIIKSFPVVDDFDRPSEITTLGDGVLFAGIDNGAVTELWRSDGTPGGTAILTTTVKPFFGYVHDLTRLNDMVIFGVYSNTLSTQLQNFASLWKTDGTPQGTQLIKANVVKGSNHAASGNTLFFAGSPAADRENIQLWKTDGTTDGTMQVKQIGPGDPDIYPRSITPSTPGSMFFIMRVEPAGYQLWKSDGSTAGTLMVYDVRPGGEDEFGTMAYVNGMLFFTADDGLNGSELWKSDGTAVGTVVVADLYPSASPSAAQELVGLKASFPRRIKPTGSSAPRDLIGLNGTLYFSATGPDGTRTLWRSDGSAAGTTPVRADAGAPLNPEELTVVQGQFMFSAADATHGRELWRSDGTAAGTVLLQDLVPGADSSNPQSFIEAGRQVFLTADTPGIGREVWALVPGGTPTPTPSPDDQRIYLPLLGR